MYRFPSGFCARFPVISASCRHTSNERNGRTRSKPYRILNRSRLRDGTDNRDGRTPAACADDSAPSDAHAPPYDMLLLFVVYGRCTSRGSAPSHGLTRHRENARPFAGIYIYIFFFLIAAEIDILRDRSTRRPLHRFAVRKRK